MYAKSLIIGLDSYYGRIFNILESFSTYSFFLSALLVLDDGVCFPRI
jgi:hypothetical protein